MGNGTYTTPTGFVPTATGTYQWVAAYSGDSNNNPASSKLGDEPETVTLASFKATKPPNPGPVAVATWRLKERWLP